MRESERNSSRERERRRKRVTETERQAGRERATQRERDTEREIKISIISERITNRDYSHIKLFSLFISFITNLDDSFRASALPCCYNDVTPSRWFC